MKKKLVSRVSFVLLALLFSGIILAQPITIDGYAYESDNRGFLNEVRVYILDVNTGDIIAQGASDMDGHFVIDIPAGQYTMSAEKDLFQPFTKTISTESVAPGAKLFEKVQMYRKPGYIFDVTLARVRDSIDAPTDGIHGAWVEIYNNTTKETIFNLKDYPHPHFKFTFEKGNYYTMLIRHKNYFTKRLEAHVDVDGCILCFEGIGDIRPSVTDNLTAGHEMGTLLTNIEMQPANIGDKITLKNIYYDYNKSDIRLDAAAELDKLVQVLRDNPAIIVELSSHTDSRGDDKYNGDLSFARAKSAVEYLVAHGIESRRILPRGYGENSLVNDCADGVDCTEAQHQENRRTELKVLGFLSEDPLANKTLAEIKEEEQFERMLLEVQNQTVIQVGATDELPAEVKDKMEKEQNAARDTIKDIAPSVEQNVKEVTEITQSPDVDMESDLEIVSSGIQKDIEEAKIRARIAAERTEQAANTQEMETPSSTGTKMKVMDIPQFIDSDGDPDMIKYLKAPYTELMPVGYSGYKVQILSANNAVDPGHAFFENNKKVFVERTSRGFSYMLGDFTSKEDAQAYLDNAVKARYKDAFIVNFKDGHRQL